MLPRQFHHVRQDVSFSSANMSLRFGVKVAPVILVAGSLPVAASSATAGDSISSSAQPTSADDVGLGSDETCDPEDADCQGDDTDEITFSMLYWVRTLFVWYSVARAAFLATMYIAGAATSLFVAIRRRMSLPGPRSSSGGGIGGSTSGSSWVGRVLGCLIRGVGGGGRGTPGARTAGLRTLTSGGAPAAAARSAVIIVPTVFTATTTTTTAGGGGGGGGSDTTAGGGVGGSRLPPRSTQDFAHHFEHRPLRGQREREHGRRPRRYRRSRKKKHRGSPAIRRLPQMTAVGA
ncbi:unnamed protein product [Ectocarpus sp. CCAP 1310/34]|nr:unnamed protein product [Ectocarpus sp. CCAP 1310/34]